MVNVLGDEERNVGGLKGGAESSRNLKSSTGWGNDTSALADDSSEEFHTHDTWKVAVSKTVVQTHDSI